MKNGGVGFRNHSAPRLTNYGSTWSEDLLFIQPVSTCVDTNLSLDYALLDHESYVSGPTRDPVTLVDRGGFSKLNTTYPMWDPAAQQANPQLRERAYQAAWLSNVFGLSQLNISNVTVGTNAAQPLILNEAEIVPGNESSPVTGRCTSDSHLGSPIEPNPFGCYADERFEIGQEGTIDDAPGMIRSLREGDDFNRTLGKMGNIATSCTFILGTAQRTDAGADPGLPFHAPNSAWSRPMYSCAIAVEATIKTVIFTYNTTADLTGLTVSHVADKSYETESDYPVCAVENLLDMGRFYMRPLWGLVSPDAAAAFPSDQLQTVQKPSIYLPRTSMLLRGHSLTPQDSQNVPGIEFPNSGLDTISSMAYLAQNMITALDLMWTDYAANAVVGTKGSPRASRGGAGSGASSIPVIQKSITTYRTAIEYSVAYAIPAVFALAILLLTSFLALVAFLFGRATLGKMKRYLNATSAGRVMVSVLYRPLSAARAVDNDMPASQWLPSEGRVEIAARKTMPVPVIVAAGAGNFESSTLLKRPAVGQEALRV
ncbi:hypothetical protein BJY01DRAFT_250465 [Aspergillus pseudoustus]|uniref:Uncharacterized protein n=1 Tax=Aspergillus pseudoustus TaxID=1810923 RepID=A0ABR4JHJ5_9EURO